AIAISSIHQPAGSSAGCVLRIMAADAAAEFQTEILMALHAQLARHEPICADPEFARDVLAGLTARPKELAPKYFYDETGSQLFEQITELPEYYPTRSELTILREHAGEIALLIPAASALIEFGSGSSRKARILLDAAPAIKAYVPVDISS